ncbi:cathepsin L-like peptidase [Alosa pseudoharengus]|uniref:cathepsin L-like peptidase n=1 Tax=Alosa pseudoharengus TaxID=34774 RepID=UPI003F89D7A5
MKLLLIAVASLAVVSYASLSLEDLEFQTWKFKFGKVYRTPEEEAQRKDIWLSTRRIVLSHNILADQGIKTYRMDMNHFSDMDYEEYRVLLGDLVPPNVTVSPSGQGKMSFRQKQGAELPAASDWRKTGCVTDVKNQGYCGSCWAFSATGALETHHCIKYGYRHSLSEQQLVDCSWSYGNEGCNGGYKHEAFQYVSDNGGIDTEASYPYEGQESYCRFTKSGIGAYCSGYMRLPYGDEGTLKAYVAYVGPVSVSIDAGQKSFQYYSSGVYNEPHCSSSETNHAVLAVGYGTENGKDYWLVKNSWGVRWGEQGYIKMARNQNNQCCIACFPYYPLV